MVQPNLAPSKPKKKKVAKNPTPKQQARVKYQKTLEKFKTRVEDPKLNTIGTPSGIQNVKGKKKGKKFINEDTSNLLAIVAEVANKNDGEIRSKLQKARDMETIREARMRENEARAESKKARMEEKGKELLKNKKRKNRKDDDDI